MGYNGSGVAFAEADGSAPLTPYAAMLEQLAEDIDDLSASTVRVGREQAHQLTEVERVRARAVAMSLAMPEGRTGADTHHARTELAERSVIAQIASSLRLSEYSARKLMWAAQCLVGQLPATLEALRDGAISFRHAQILVEQVAVLDPESLSMLEQAVLARGAQQTPTQFERSLRTMSEKLNLESMIERQAATADKRITYVEPMRDGMGRYVLEAPIVQVIAIDNFVTDRAKSLQVEGELRTHAQLKSDVASDLLLAVDLPRFATTGPENTIEITAGVGDGPVARYRNIRPRLLVTVPALTMLRRGSGSATGTQDVDSQQPEQLEQPERPEQLEQPGLPEQPEQPGWLEGYGPIDPQTAREIAANAKSMIRILTHPETGAALSIGRKRYRIHENLRLWLRYRDGRCRFPGGNRSAAHAEIDHGREWAADAGRTDHVNLAALCPGHHTLKGNSDWQPLQDPQGSGEIMWITPTGHVLFTEPENRVEP